jgi:hypothetical protein
VRRGGPPTALVLGLLAAAPARADEPLFGYVNTTDLLPRGKWQAEQQLTARTGQAGGRYRRLEGRTEAEVGLRDNLQATLYLNYAYVDADRNSPRGLTEGLGVRPGHDPATPYHRGRFDGATAEIVWRLVSPYLAPVGLAVLGDVSAGPDLTGGRLRGIVQKNFRADTLVLAANLSAEWEKRPAATPGPPVRPSVSALEFAAGASYRFRPNWSLALEYRRRAEYAGSALGGRSQYVADFAGPTLHYGGRRWFATLAVMRQLHARVRDPGLGAGSADGLVFATRHTRWDGVRLRLGRTF